MPQRPKLESARQTAGQLDAEIEALSVKNTANVRAIRRRYSRELRAAPATFVLDLARELMEGYGHRWVAYELLRDHKGAFGSIGERELEVFGRGIDSWSSVDAFARTLAGPAWLRGQVSDVLIRRWARSDDRWWRRAALVSTVALNVRSRGGMGDVPRTLRVCRILADDQDDMVVKAMSWALRELVVHDHAAVREFLGAHDSVLAARVKREVMNKLTTGLKNPGRRAKST
ncbi:MAG: DNA alkylation repair protein [Anaerolineae bacterium]|jgi:3-methyladenine DNA glycosylase AlkD